MIALPPEAAINKSNVFIPNLISILGGYLKRSGVPEWYGGDGIIRDRNVTKKDAFRGVAPERLKPPSKYRLAMKIDEIHRLGKDSHRE
jgi:hypothetical protein